MVRIYDVWVSATPDVSIHGDRDCYSYLFGRDKRHNQPYHRAVPDNKYGLSIPIAADTEYFYLEKKRFSLYCGYVCITWICSGDGFSFLLCLYLPIPSLQTRLPISMRLPLLLRRRPSLRTSLYPPRSPRYATKSRS